MGRAKLRLELISNEKARRKTYETRIKCIVKKAEELTTLCGVELCMILYAPPLENQVFPEEPTVWTAENNNKQVERMIASYKISRNSNDCRSRTYGLTSFFKDQIEKVEEKIKKLRKENRELKYPSWDERYNFLSVDQLTVFMGVLSAKIDAAKVAIDSRKKNRVVAVTEPRVPTNPMVQGNNVVFDIPGRGFSDQELLAAAYYNGGGQPLGGNDYSGNWGNYPSTIFGSYLNNPPICDIANQIQNYAASGTDDQNNELMNNITADPSMFMSYFPVYGDNNDVKISDQNAFTMNRYAPTPPPSYLLPSMNNFTGVGQLGLQIMPAAAYLDQGGFKFEYDR